MNKIILLALIGAIVIGGFVYLKKTNNPFINLNNDGTEQQEETSDFVYTSFTGETEVVEVEFNNTAETVAFTQSAVGSVTLVRAQSASGVRYVNEDETVVFWEHQGEATITKNGEEVFKGSSLPVEQ